ncbi:hypothetical protein FYJ88_02780 [Corynebacterium urealyticum]|uniref:PIN domain-containing protein n=1 Tax=Corynebacterium urealyticum TaxID=43771 RepID=UPI0011E83088|nr:PIN domain-containing protein [Corynebacterium urealyticum]TYR17778.1 hypothetical protein FYJ88_02780 [Corynebacterium urealyticum]
MEHRPIMDAGPGINFFPTNKERLLFATLGPLAIPEVVREEITRKATQDPRFAAANRVMSKLPARLLETLSDDVTPELGVVVSRLTGLPLMERKRRSRDLGELMVIAHAVVAAEQGNDVIVLIDDGEGRRMANQEARRLQRLRASGSSVGSLALISTVTVLKNAAGKEELPDRSSLRKLYARLRSLDDGLKPLEETGLLDLDAWRWGR